MSFGNDSHFGRPTRVLFIAWGYSIHAKRRIQLFVDDPGFEVTVVSTFNYEFERANNILLDHTLEKSSLIKLIFKKSFRILSRMVRKVFFVLGKEIDLLDEEILEAIKHYGILKKVVAQYNHDVIFLQTLLYPCYLSFFLKRSIPIVITFWNGDVLWWAKWTGIERIFKKQITTYGTRRAKAITVNSVAARDACFGYGAEKEKVHLIRYPGVDLSLFKPMDKDQARENMGISKARVVMSPRGLGNYRNSEVIVYAASRVIAMFPDTLFIFLGCPEGQNEDLDKHKQIARDLGIENHFLWLGSVDYKDMIKYYTSSTLMVSMCSNDSLPNAMLEAMACGVPVIMGDIPQIREWVTDSYNGFLVPTRNSEILASKIIQIFDNKDGLVDKFIERNLSLVFKEFNGKTNIEAIKNLVHSIAKKDE